MRWASQDARQVQYAHTVQRSIAGWHRPRVRVCELDDLDAWKVGHGLSLRMRRPLFGGARHRAALAVGGQRILQLLGVAASHRGGNLGPISGAAQHGHGTGRQVGKVAMQVHPAVVTAAVQVYQRIAIRPGRWRWAAIQAHHQRGPQRDTRLADVDADLLTPASLERPQVGRCDAAGGQSNRGSLAHREAVTQDRIVAYDRRLLVWPHLQTDFVEQFLDTWVDCAGNLNAGCHGPCLAAYRMRRYAHEDWRARRRAGV